MTTTKTKTICIVAKEDFLWLCRQAEVKHYNRQLETEQIAELPSDRFGMLPLLLHEHVAGEHQQPENFQVRTWCYTSTGKRIGELDVQVGLWNMLTRDNPIEFLLPTFSDTPAPNGETNGS